MIPQEISQKHQKRLLRVKVPYYENYMMAIVLFTTGRTVTINDKENVQLWDEKTRQLIKSYGNISKLLQICSLLVQKLLSKIKDANKDISIRGADALAQFKVTTSDVIDGVLELLKDKDHSVRRSAAYALGQLNVNTREVIECLLVALQDEDSAVRISAAYALGQMGIKTPEVVQDLLHVLKDIDYFVRGNAASALGKLKVASGEVVQGLLVAFKDRDEHVGGKALDALNELKAMMLDDILEGLSVVALEENNVHIQRNIANLFCSILDVLKNDLKDDYAAIEKILLRRISSHPQVVMNQVSVRRPM